MPEETTLDAVEPVEGQVESGSEPKAEEKVPKSRTPPPRGTIDRDNHLRLGGRVISRNGKERFPSPRFRKFNSDSNEKGQRPDSAFNWADALPQEFKDRCDWYVYRRHPVLVEPPIDEETRRPKWFKYIDKISGADPNPITCEQDLLNRYGCGRYELYLNETDKERGEDSRCILQVFVQNLGGADYRANPPNDDLINDVNKVDLSHPNNKGYLSYLMSIGKLPDQVNAEKDRQEMATATVVDKLTDGYEKMADKVVKMAETRATSRPEPAPSSGLDSTAIAGLLNSTGEVMKQSAMTVMEQSKGMGLDEVLKVAKELKADDTGSNSEIKELRNMLFTMQTERINKLETMLLEQATVKAANPGSAATASPADPFSYFESGLNSLKKMKSTIDDFSGSVDDGTGSGLGKGAPWWASLLAAGMPHIATITQTVAGMYMAGQQAQAAGTQPIQPPMQPPMQGGFPGHQPQTTQPSPAGLPAPSPVPPAPVNGAPTGNVNGAATATINGGFDLNQFLPLVQIPLLNYLNDPDSEGGHFAEWVVGGYGIDVFKTVKSYGAMIEPILIGYTIQLPNGQSVAPFANLPPGRLNKFVDEFLSVEEADFDKPDSASGSKSDPAIVD